MYIYIYIQNLWDEVRLMGYSLMWTNYSSRESRYIYQERYAYKRAENAELVVNLRLRLVTLMIEVGKVLKAFTKAS